MLKKYMLYTQSQKMALQKLNRIGNISYFPCDSNILYMVKVRGLLTELCF